MKLFCPLPRRFAVIQMDPVGMVKHYDDSIALSAAQAMKPKKYLVYLSCPQELPTPTKPWFRYEITPIAATLRQEVPEEGITADMVIPIYPNTSHPTGRAAITPEAPFPFPNCYFWIVNNLTIRLRRKAIRYDDSCAPMLSIPEDQSIEDRFMEDYLRISSFRRAKLAEADGQVFEGDRAGQAASPSLLMGPPSESRPPLGTDPRGDLRGDVRSLAEDSPGSHDDSQSDSDSVFATSSGGDTPPTDDPVASLLQLDFFGLNTDDTIELLPLVDLWFEVTEHLTAETIPSPVELYKERDAIMQIIHDARERAPSIRSPYMGSVVSIDYDAISDLDVAPSENDLPWFHGDVLSAPAPSAMKTTLPTSRRARALATWHRMGCAAKRIFTAPFSWRVHPPCMPFWP